MGSRFCSRCALEFECTAARAKATDAAVVHLNSLATKTDVGPSGSNPKLVSLVNERMLRGKTWSSLKVTLKEGRKYLPCVVSTFLSQEGKNVAQRG